MYIFTTNARVRKNITIIAKALFCATGMDRLTCICRTMLKQSQEFSLAKIRLHMFNISKRYIRHKTTRLTTREPIRNVTDSHKPRFI